MRGGIVDYFPAAAATSTTTTVGGGEVVTHDNNVSSLCFGGLRIFNINVCLDKIKPKKKGVRRCK